jgi:hypothetical protein
MEKQTHSIEKAIDQIRLAGEKKDIAEFEQLSDSLIEKWQDEEPDQVAALLLEICNNLSSYDFKPREKRMELLGQYASKALYQSDFPLEINQQIAFQHHLYYTKKQKNWEEGPIFKSEREQFTLLWLNTLSQLLAEIKKDFNFEDLPDENIQPPLETGLPAGIDPMHIEDSILRKRYEMEIEKNRLKTEIYNKQIQLHQIFNDYPTKLENYLLDVYSANQEDIVSLNKLFKQTALEEPFQKKIISSLKPEK